MEIRQKGNKLSNYLDDRIGWAPKMFCKGSVKIITLSCTLKEKLRHLATASHFGALEESHQAWTFSQNAPNEGCYFHVSNGKIGHVT